MFFVGYVIVGAQRRRSHRMREQIGLLEGQYIIIYTRIILRRLLMRGYRVIFNICYINFLSQVGFSVFRNYHARKINFVKKKKKLNLQ